jgi:hypothetical protein
VTVATKNRLQLQLTSHLAFQYAIFLIVPVASVKQNVGAVSMATRSMITGIYVNQLKIKQIVQSIKIVRFAILKEDV